MAVCVWLHGESISRWDPALVANPDAPALFVFDEYQLQKMQLSFKRLFFMAEGVEEAFAHHRGPTALFRGDTVEVILAYAAEHGCDTVCVTEASVPGFKRILEALHGSIYVELYRMPDMMPEALSSETRATRFWRKYEAHAFEDSGTPDAIDELDSTPGA